MVMRHRLVFGLAGLLYYGCPSTPPPSEAPLVMGTPPGVTVTTGENSPAPDGVTLSILDPRDGSILPSDEVQVVLETRNFQAADKGPHVHVIVDNEAYLPCYDLTKPFKLPAKLAEGPHVIRAFPSRGAPAAHESIKTPGCFGVAQFWVKSKAGDLVLDPRKPLLTYSRPKGAYKGEEAKRILFDFYVTNAELGEGKATVRYTLDGATNFVKEWKPTYFEGLAAGEHTLTIELIGPDGKPVDGPYNKTTRKFHVEP